MAERMANFSALRRGCARLTSLLLALAMLVTMLTGAALAEETAGKVRVIVENNTFTRPVNGKNPAWTGELLDTWVAIDENSTMMSCIYQALTENNVSQTGADSGYISEIGGLSQVEGGTMSGWMGTLNDWFTNDSFSAFSVADGSLAAGDEIRVAYTCDGGPDLGGDFFNNNKTLKAVAFSVGEMDKAFGPEVYEYTLNVPAGTSSVKVTPTAANKNYQVRTYIGETEYKRTSEVPVENGTVITVKCGDPSWPSMNGNDGAAQVYTFTVAQAAQAITPIEAYVTIASGSALLKDKTGASAVDLKVELNTKAEYTIDDILRAAHEQYAQGGAADYATATGDYGAYITKLWGVETANAGYYRNGSMAMGLTDKVDSGDRIEAMIYENAYPDTEAYAAFDQAALETDDETAFQVTLKEATFDESYNMVMVPCQGATITVDGEATEFVTDEEGKATVTIAAAGEHVLSATKKKTTGEGEAAREISAITAPHCRVTVAKSAIASGKSGNVVWKLRPDGTLEFTAVPDTDGRMNDVSSWSTPPWGSYASKIKSVVLKEGVANIGDFAFKGYTLESLSLPASLTEIGSNAFNNAVLKSVTVAEGGYFSVSGNYLLKNNGTEIHMVIDRTQLTGVVTIPEGVTTLGRVFSSTDITGVIFPSTLTTIGQNAFSNCKKLETVTVPCDIPASNTFSGCTALKSVTLAEGVTTVGYRAFNGCTALSTLNLPRSLTTMTGTALNNCSAVAEINVAEGGAFRMKDGLLLKNDTEVVFALRIGLGSELTIPEGITTIGEAAFDGCKEITSVKFPSTLKTMEDDGFWGCKGLTSVTLPEGFTTLGASAFASCSNLETIHLPSTLESIGASAFSMCEKLRTAVLPDGLKTLGNKAFYGCAALEGEITVPCSVGESSFEGCEALKRVTVKDGAAAVAANAFKDCTALESASLPSTITSLSASAFAGCTALKSLTIAEGGTYRVSDGLICTATQIVGVMPYLSGEVTIPEGIVEVSDGAFSQNTAITAVHLPASLTRIGQKAFYKCTALTTVSVAETGLETIGNNAFDGCQLLKSFALPASLKTLGSNAFSNCSSLSTPVIPAGLQALNNGTFWHCTGMTGTLILPGTIVTYGNGVFNGCTGLEGVIMEDCVDPDNAQYGSQLFYGCTGLTSIRLPENIKSMSSMLYGCSGLTRLVLPASITTVDGNCLNGSQSLRYLEIQGATTVASISTSGALLEQLVLPATLTTYSDSAMYCHPQMVCFRGTQEQWEQISFHKDTLANFEKYGTVVVFEYDEETSAGEAPVITRQPESATYAKGLRCQPLSIQVQQEADTQYFYSWYRDGQAFASGTECPVTTANEGTFEFYCIVKSVKGNKIGEVKSDVATITITQVEALFQGEGTQENPYLLSTPEDFERLSVFVEGGESYEGKFFKMTGDVTLPKNWVPVGCTKDGTRDIKKGANMNAFSGTFDGGNFRLTVPAGEKPLFGYVYRATIQNLRIYGEQIEGYGLINNMEGVGLSGSAVVIDHVTIETGTKIWKSGLLGAEITTNGFAGCSAGYVSTIRNCTIQPGVIIGYKGDQSMIGSFAGRLQGSIENCESAATVMGTQYVGGIIGTRDNAMGNCSVAGCSFTGKVIATGKNAGGIVGGGYQNGTAPNGGKITITDCTVTGAVSGDENVGGILGADEYVAQSWGGYKFIGNTFTGTVSGNKNVGAMIGYYKSMNMYDDISGNRYAANHGADRPLGGIWLIDTSCENPTELEGVTYINTANGTSGLPVVQGCSWKANHNRTDDPLGRDRAKLFAEIGAEVLLGDVDQNGEIDLDDVLLLIDYTLGREGAALTEAQLQAADVDQNGEIDLDDALLIIDYTRGVVSEFTPAGDHSKEAFDE